MIKYVILLASVAVVAQCLFVCPKNVCDGIKCEDLSECKAENGYKVRENGGWCRCCDICVRVIGENEHCTPPIELGVIYNYECAEGTYCHPDLERCVKV